MSESIENKLIIQALESSKKDLKSIINNDAFWNEFINTLEFSALNNNEVVLNVKNLFAKQVLTNDFLKPITKAINNASNGNFDVFFKVKEEPHTTSSSQSQKTKLTTNTNVNKNYTFDNFIVNEFNKSAYAATQSIFQQAYWNPIFISGGVGLGKTHLLFAVGNEYIKLHPEKNVRYITTDEFIREVYGAFSKGGNVVEEVKTKYQSYDLLLMDDIQFLAKKDKMNEIFFNIFNSNVAEGKIIVMTSDKPPIYLENFEERIKSRFASGLTIKISNPDLVAMANIMEHKIREAGESFVFNKEAIQYIVHRNPRDIRQLEGYLHRILFHAVNNLPPRSIITPEIIQKYIEKEQDENWKQKGYDIDPNLVIEQIACAYNINADLIKSKTRTQQVTQVRNICMHALRHKFDMPFEQIGSFFNRHHTTVMEGVEKINQLLKKDESLQAYITNLYKKM